MARTSRIRNTLDGREKRPGLAALMRPKVIFSLVLIGIFSFTALVTLSGYAGDLRQQNNGQAHALSRSAIGYGGLVRLLGDLDYDVRMARAENVSREDRSVLRIFTMSRPYQVDGMDELGLTSPVLIIMPKWVTAPLPDKPGWVQRGLSRTSTFPPHYHESGLQELIGDVDFKVIAPDDKSASHRVTTDIGPMASTTGVKIENLQVIQGDQLEAIYAVNLGPVLARVEDSSTYILSDPDFMNTMGISRRTRARLALDMIETVISDAGADPMRVDFDLTVHGFGSNSNIVKVLTQPPFLAATLCLLAAGGLIAWQAFSRFGDPLPTRRDYALGKFSLADNAARFIRIAGREPNMSRDYADLVRKQVVKDLNLEGRRAADIDSIMRRREQALDLGENFSDLQRRAGTTMDTLSLMRLAEDLDNWKKRMTTGEQNEPR